MHRIFGEKPEPWLALQKETQKHVTLQGESQFDPIAGPIGTSPGEILANERVLEQLYRTPTLHGARTPTAEGSALLHTPVDSSALMTMPLRAAESEVTPPRRNKLALVIGVGALVAVAAAVVTTRDISGSRPMTPASDPPRPAAFTLAAPVAVPADTALDAEEIAQTPPEPTKPATARSSSGSPTLTRSSWRSLPRPPAPTSRAACRSQSSGSKRSPAKSRATGCGSACPTRPGSPSSRSRVPASSRSPSRSGRAPRA